MKLQQYLLRDIPYNNNYTDFGTNSIILIQAAVECVFCCRMWLTHDLASI